MIMNDVRNNVTLGFRLTAVAPKGFAQHNRFNKLSPREVLEAHNRIADEKGLVAFGTNSRFNTRRWGQVNQVLFFADSLGQRFFAMADAEDILEYPSPTVFPVAAYGEIETAEWSGMPYKTFLILRNFRWVSEDDLSNFVSISDPSTDFSVLSCRPRFRVVYLRTR